MYQRFLFLFISIVFVSAAFLEVYSQPFVYRKIPDDMLASFKVTDNEYDNIMSASSGYYNILNALPSNYVTDGSVDYTEYIQKALNENRDVIFPPFPILVSMQYNQSGLMVSSNSTLVFPKGAKLILKSTSSANYQIIKIHNVENVKIYYPVIQGERYSHLGATGEWGMGISIAGSKNIQIEKPYITDCWGDGIYIATTTAPVMVSRNVIINGAVLDNNRRCGIAIISGDSIVFNNTLSANTNGTAPRCGVDIEPNNNKDTIRRITFNNMIAYNNHTFGFDIVLFHLRGTPGIHSDIDIKVNGLKIYYSAYSIGFSMYNASYSSGAPLAGSVLLNDVLITDNEWRFFQISDAGQNTVPVCVNFAKAPNKSQVEAFYVTEIKKSSNYTMNCNTTPVTMFENLNASASNGQLSVTWNTINEVYSNYFDIELSRDSSNYKKIGSVRSRATNYTSALGYTFNIKLESAVGMLAVIPISFFLLLFNKHFRRTTMILILFFMFLSYWGCKKETVPIVDQKGDSSKYFIRVVQIDGDGNQFLSPVISLVVTEIQK